MVTRPRWGASAASNRRQRQVVIPDGQPLQAATGIVDRVMSTAWQASASSNRLQERDVSTAWAGCLCQHREAPWQSRLLECGGQHGGGSTAGAASLRVKASSCLQDSQLCLATSAVYARCVVEQHTLHACCMATQALKDCAQCLYFPRHLQHDAGPPLVQIAYAC